MAPRQTRLPVRDQSINSNKARRGIKARVLAEETHCHLCGHPVPPNPHTAGSPEAIHYAKSHPLAPAVDELHPRSHGGSATDRGNVRLAHRLCNGIRSNSPITASIRARCRDAITARLAGTTSRNW